MNFASPPELIAAIRDGQVVIVVDDENRENEGDFIVAAEHATPEAINQLVTLGRGLVCAPLAPEIADRLELPTMREEHVGDGKYGCAFTVSVDARQGITTGISAEDRSLTAKLLANPDTKPSDLRRPGHIFPLRARAGGVIERPGHTEAGIDLARLAGLAPAAIICEILKDDGTMARVPDLFELAEREGFLIGTIEDLIAYRREHDATNREPRPTVRHISEARMPTPLGVFDIHVYKNAQDEELVALVMGGRDALTAEDDEAPLVRVHSECFTGDVLGSLRCDCQGQLHMALRAIGESERGVLIYLPQEGRGIGLAKKIEAYKLQEQGRDTVEANEELGYPADLRSYADAAEILRGLGLSKVRLMTNNPRKIEGLARHGVEIVERVAIETGPGTVNHEYLKTKKGKLGHFFKAV